MYNHNASKTSEAIGVNKEILLEAEELVKKLTPSPAEDIDSVYKKKKSQHVEEIINYVGNSGDLDKLKAVISSLINRVSSARIEVLMDMIKSTREED